MGKRSRRIRLAPSRLIEIREGLADRCRAAAGSADDWGAGFAPMMEAAWGAAGSLSVAPAWWVSADMEELAVAASHGVPEDVPPATMSGFIAFERDLPPACSDGLGLPVRAIHWMAERRGDGFRVGMQFFTADKSVLREAGETRLPLAPIPADSRVPASAALGSVIRAVWALSSEDRVCEVVDGPAVPRGSGRPDDPAARLVKFLVLRAPRRRSGGDGDGSGAIEFSHRFIVRGFWRNQPCGPRNSERRLQWIPPYIKGPEGKPLVTRETVRVWKR